MIGLIAILSADGQSDPVKYLTRAFDHYSRVPGRFGRMLATRAMLACAMYQSAAGRWAGAAPRPRWSAAAHTPRGGACAQAKCG